MKNSEEFVIWYINGVPTLVKISEREKIIRQLRGAKKCIE